MSSDRWEHIQELYHAALELEPTQRSAFLKEACGDDEAVCREVEALLAEHGKAGSFLETPPWIWQPRYAPSRDQRQLWDGRLVLTRSFRCSVWGAWEKSTWPRIRGSNAALP